MKKSEVDLLLDDPNSVLLEEDREALEQLSPTLLQRIRLGLQTPAKEEVPVTNAKNSQISELQKELATCQQSIIKCLNDEAEIRAELAGLGVESDSIADQFIAVNNESTEAELTDESVYDFVASGRTPYARILNEGIEARELVRRNAVNIVLSNTGGRFTEEEVRAWTTPVLNKFASVFENMSKKRKSEPVFNYAGMGMADNMTTMGGNQGGAPMEIPKTYDPLNDVIPAVRR